VRAAATVAALALALLAIRASWVRWRGSDAMDFYQFWLVGQAAGQPGVGNVYSPAERRHLGAVGWELANRPEASPGQRIAASRRLVLETYSTPFLYAVFNALGTGDYEIDYAIYQALSLAAAAVGAGLLALAFGHPAGGALLAVAAVFALLGPQASDARVGNVNQLQLGWLALLLGLLRLPERHARDFVTGVLAGALVAFKPNLLFAEALLLCAWLLHGRRHTLSWHLLGAALGGAAAVCAASAFFGTPGVWLQWLSALRGMGAELDLPLRQGNDSLARLLFETTGVDVAFSLTLVFAGAALAALWAARPRAGAPDRERDFEVDVLALCSGIAISLLGARLAWLHYFLLLVPALLHAFRPPYSAPLRLVAAAIAAACLIAPRLVSPALFALQTSMAAALMLAYSLARLTRLAAPALEVGEGASPEAERSA
jgi:hypothetical protein